MLRNLTKIINNYGIDRKVVSLRLNSTQGAVKATTSEVKNNGNGTEIQPSDFLVQAPSNKTSTSQPMTFAKLFKKSKFVALGGLKDCLLIGKIVDVVGDDLYVDYGGKFNCICKVPRTKTPSSYKKYSNVVIKLHSFEMASYFLNSAKHLTLLESDAEIISPVFFDNKPENQEKNELIKSEINELNSEPYL